MKTIQKAGLATLAACSLIATSALAGPNNPPKDSGRTVIEDAGDICGSATDATMLAICALRFDSNGSLDDSTRGCELGGAEISDDNGVVVYKERNCDKNEAAQVRAASSAVLSWNDTLPPKNKSSQELTTVEYLCGYAVKYGQLVGAGKLVSTKDLGEEARDLAEGIIGWDYCGY